MLKKYSVKFTFTDLKDKETDSNINCKRLLYFFFLVLCNYKFKWKILRFLIWYINIYITLRKYYVAILHYPNMHLLFISNLFQQSFKLCCARRNIYKLNLHCATHIISFITYLIILLKSIYSSEKKVIEIVFWAFPIEIKILLWSDFCGFQVSSDLSIIWKHLSEKKHYRSKTREKINKGISKHFTFL